MTPDPAVMTLLSENSVTAVPDESGKRVFIAHVPASISLERAVFPDLVNVRHAVDALLGEAGKTGWVGHQGLEP